MRAIKGGLKGFYLNSRVIFMVREKVVEVSGRGRRARDQKFFITWTALQTDISVRKSQRFYFSLYSSNLLSSPLPSPTLRKYTQQINQPGSQRHSLKEEKPTKQ